MKKIAVIFLLLPLALSAQRSQLQSGYAGEISKMAQFLGYLGGNYVEDVNMTETVDSAIINILSKLDPHSVYISSDDLKSELEELDANFDGIGIEFRVVRDTIMVVNTISGGPSEKVGLLPNDRIIGVEGKSVIGIKETEVVKYLKGPKGTAVNITVRRQGVGEDLGFRIIRDKIPLYTIDAAYKIDDKTGYIKINRFANTTNRELQEALAEMEGIDALILDLQSNGGGILGQSVQVSNNFIKKGSLIVSMEGRSVPTERFFARQDTTFPDGKLIVLVDEFSASASEIVAGAIQDWDRGVIIGRRTFGKGLVQSQYRLLDGSAIRLTVARYHTPSGRVIQAPYEKGNSTQYYADFIDRINKGDNNISLADSTEFKTLVRERTIYGGGGIMPDVVVERDTTLYSAYWSKLTRAGVVVDCVTDYIDKNRKTLVERFPDFESFDRGFDAEKEILPELVKLSDSKGVACDEDQTDKSKEVMLVQLKALIAQRLWGMGYYYRVANPGINETYNKALEFLGNWDENVAKIMGAE